MDVGVACDGSDKEALVQATQGSGFRAGLKMGVSQS